MIEQKKIGKRLDESEVVIVSPIEDDHQQLPLHDTSHVSVVTVGDEREQVKDSSALAASAENDRKKKMVNGQVIFSKAILVFLKIYGFIRLDVASVLMDSFFFKLKICTLKISFL